jgi:hypothetical protein
MELAVLCCRVHTLPEVFPDLLCAWFLQETQFPIFNYLNESSVGAKEIDLINCNYVHCSLH